MNAIGEVSRVEVTILMDDYSGYKSSYLGQHGLSILIDILSDGKVERILFDAGQSASTILYNMNLAGVNPESIDRIFISHCHYDHTRGLSGIIRKMKKSIPIIGHTDIFRENYSIEPEFTNLGITWENRRENLVKSGAELILENRPYKIVNGVISTGEVERNNDFEGIVKGLYCIENGKMVIDPMKDDNSMIINIKDKGLLIVTGCSHAGIINIIEHSIKISGVQRIYGIIGGLHLIDSPSDVIDRTIEELQKYDISLIAVGHCTGIEFIYKLQRIYKEKLVILHSGKQIII